ncbi:MAG: terminase small subunit [Methylococcales bacterium]|nr:terminase small subunit [Methylococcales bacterium]
MPRTLTPKQENFCQQFISTGNASEAYRQMGLLGLPNL